MDHVDLEHLYKDLVLTGTSTQPAVTLHLVTALNGAATGPDGRSGTLGGEADLVAMRRVRDGSDAILVGGSTVRAEGYGPVRSTPERRAARERNGLAALPRLAVLTNGGVDTERLRGDGDRPVLITSNDELAGDEHAEVVVLEEPITAPALLAVLHDLGLHRILCEGGPSLAQWLLEAELVDELFLTVAPAIVGGQPRLLPDPLPVLALELRSAARHQDDVLLRYAVRR